MKLNSAKEVWIARVIAWVVLGVISCGIIFATTFMLGPSLFVIPNLNDKIALASIGGMFGIGGLIGVLISIPLMLAPFFVIRKKKV